MDLTDRQWDLIAPLFEERRRPDGRGRPWREARGVLNGVLWTLRTGAPWKDLPDRYPPYQTCHRRFQQWRRRGVFDEVLTRLAEDLRRRGKLDLTEGFVDASFSSAKKGALSSVLRSAAKATKSWQSSTAAVFLSPYTWRALHQLKFGSSSRRSTAASSRPTRPG